MASLDLSDAFDASFLTEMEVIHRTAKINEEGDFEFTEAEPEPFLGVVTPEQWQPSNSAENQFIEGSILIYSKTKLQPQGLNQAADIIIYNNKRYKVNTLLDYGTYGVGFWRVQAFLEEEGNDYEGDAGFSKL